MKNDRFNDYITQELAYCCRLLIDKNEEYAEANEDRLEAFKHAAAFERSTPQRALMGMLTKHLISLEVMTEKEKITAYPMNKWGEKITDALNYRLLLGALVREAYDEEFVARPQEGTCCMKTAPEKPVEEMTMDEAEEAAK